MNPPAVPPYEGRLPLCARLEGIPMVALDTETTGTDPAKDRMIEVAHITWQGDLRVTGRRLFDPGVEIPPESSAVHGWRTSELRKVARPLDDLSAMGIGSVVHGAVVLIHNAPFDWPLLLAECERVGAPPPAPLVVIDTLVLARKLWPDLARHTLGTLHHALGHHSSLAPTHGALQDCVAVSAVFQDMLARIANPELPIISLAEVAELAATPAPPDTMKFGKHIGKRIAELPTDYLRWWVFKVPTERPDYALDLAMIGEYKRRVSTGSDVHYLESAALAGLAASRPYTSRYHGPAVFRKIDAKEASE